MGWESTKSLIRTHIADDTKRFDALENTFKQHDLNVNEKHHTNTATLARIEASQKEMQGNLDAITKLRPALEAGIAADAKADYRKKLARRVLGAVVSTLVAVGGMFPLLLWLLSLRVSVAP